MRKKRVTEFNKRKFPFNWKQILAWVSLALLVGYWAGANIFLNSRAFRNLLQSWDDGILVYTWIVTPFPGVAFLGAPGVTHQDKHVRWNLSTNRALILFSPFALLTKEVRFYNVSIGTARFRFVMKKNVDGKRRKDALPVEFYPNIPFPKPVKEKPKKENTDDKNGKWSVHMTGVSIGALEEAWVNEYHYTGKIGIQGGFRILPDKEVEVGPARVQFSPGDFLLGNKKVAESLEGTVQYKMDPFDPNGPDEQIFGSTSVSINLVAKAGSLEPLNVYFSSIPWFKLLEGGGDIHLQVNVSGGRLLPPASIQFDTDRLQVQLGKFHASGMANLEWKIEDGRRPLGKFKGVLKEPEIQHRGKVLLTGGALELKGETEDLQFERLFEGLRLAINLKQGRLGNLSVLNSFLPPQSPVKFEGGKSTLDIELSTDSRRLGEDQGKLAIKGSGSRVRLKQQVLEGDLQVSLPFHKSKIQKGELHFKESDVLFLNASLIEAGNKKTSWWAQVKVPQADLTAEPTVVRSTFEVLMKNSLPVVPLVTGVSHGETLLAHLLTVENIRARGSFHASPIGFELTDLHLDSSSLKIQGFYREKEDIATARMLVVVEPFAVGLLIAQSQTRLILNDAFNWYKKDPTLSMEIETEPVSK